ncbi:hypothetical protein HPB47_023203 [Ixodes persulcatus]|uniref:Uncharacterized protein n=1 Tax=Ixodes persulcatus TaxID=34615 RepID=A0AC60Q9P5_IXOPE|nr:hypothetical protein HPB47_023203 [Ixodes persulcatus]
MSRNTRPTTRARDQGRNPAGEGPPIERDPHTVGDGSDIAPLGSASPPDIAHPESRELQAERCPSPTPRDASPNTDGPPVDTFQEQLPLLLAGMIRLLQEREATSRLLVQPATDMPRLRLEIPKYAGYADTKSVADFLLELRDYQEASGISEVALLARVLPVALTGSAADWRRRQQSFLNFDNFAERFRSEFLPPDYAEHIRDELRARTAEPSASPAERVARAIRQSHPQFHPYLRGRSFSNLDAMARAASQIQADIMAELNYRPPPQPEDSLEPSCASSGRTPYRGAADGRAQYPRHHPGMMPRALDPHAYALTQNAHSLPGGRALVQRLGAPQPETQYEARRWITDRDRTNYTAAMPRRLQPSQTSEHIPSPPCFQCGGVGHFRRNCPSSSTAFQSGNEVIRR